MLEFYPEIRWTHIAMVLASGGLFAARGIAVQLGAAWPLAAPVRWLSYTIDTALLTAALMLLTILPGVVFHNGWLTVKLVLLVGYVVLGSYALKRGRSAQVRLWCLVAALLTYVSMLSIARSHHPLGHLRALL
jgi:uncharacterized membrane protein SirB2